MQIFLHDYLFSTTPPAVTDVDWSKLKDADGYNVQLGS
jgi:hypothetical protein